ncbi:MAG: hypothetical protein OHK93_002038 [Ramalina farinacea]|uniref:Uncharacterized protein n=1 Tax=Ramalina farinacea TaxID=258253 RepID=A0AA43TWT1_9LECA|nr:hypothetical protein [Ramalina farinacea]
MQTPSPFYPQTAAVGLDSSNDIECDGSLPDWPLPIPNEWQAAVNTDPLSLQSLCSASLLGGNSYFNAGGYCHQDDQTRRKDVWFTDEMTPNPALRGQRQPPKNRSISPLWRFLVKAQLRDKLPGGVDLAVENPDGSSTSVNVIPQQDSKKQKTRAGFSAILSQSGSLFGKRTSLPSIGTGFNPLPNGRADLEERDSSLTNVTNLSNWNLTDLSNVANLTDSSDASQANVTFVQSANQSIFAEFFSDDYNDLPSVTEAIDNENPPANLTAWMNETSLEAYTSLNTLPSYVWCACNCTYISWGCCDPHNLNGIVQEPASYNKGHIGNCTVSNGAVTTSNTTSSMDLNLSSNVTASSHQMKSDLSSNDTTILAPSLNDTALSAPSATESVAQDMSLSTSASSTSSPAPRPTVCTTKCRSAVRACEWWCTCQAPPVGLFFWFQGACGPRYKKRSLRPSFFDEDIASSSDSKHIRRQNSVHLTTNATARQLLGTDLPANAINRPAPGGQRGGTLLGNKVTMQMIPGAPYPAPCNESYISYACADSTDGLVYEPPEMWLGALLPDDDTSPSVLPPAPERWLQINGLDDSFNKLNKVVS